MTTTTKAINWQAGQNIVKRGTPIDADGNVSNTSAAIGIVAEDVERPNSATVLTAGEWDEVTNYNGITLSDDCKRALAAIVFVGAEGELRPVSTLPAPALDDAEKVPAVNEYGTAYALTEVTEGGGLSLVAGEGLSITWNGDITGKDTITLWDEYVFYKVSDTVLSPTDINGSAVIYEDGDIYNDRTAFAVAPDETALLYGNGESIEVVSGTEGEHTLRDEYGDEAQIVLPSSGTYFLFYEQYGSYVASLVKQGSPKLVQGGVDVTEQIANLIAQYQPSAE